MDIDVTNLCCGYHGKAILKNIDFRIAQGEMWCVLGANGVGKTTFFRTVLGLLKPVSGTIAFDGRDMAHWSRKELARHIAYVPQSHTPPFPFLVEEVIAMGRNPYQQGVGRLLQSDLAAIDLAVETLGIGYLLGKRYTQISGGERQLTLLARAIAQQTPVLVLDEPVANLDFGNQARVLSHVCRLVTKLGHTIIMTTHCPDHGFIADANVFLLFQDSDYRVGLGRNIMTEEAVRALYHIDNRIVDIASCGRMVCVPLYDEDKSNQSNKKNQCAHRDLPL